ncbi:ABC transporter permease [Homoserinibacter sp. YIM 151385]|uniref:ABC transporter permease n=1 Tax=Homoserinibacter sp. YIM 151385 TaxID=2985506 RepID=UPI0022F0BB4B|nr:ABC transporter permease [Homoserinibacter sp. YIM 151385]WBU37094.1 ABC transporter permease [Homoserinibacter sp. YIM 151385]
MTRTESLAVAAERGSTAARRRRRSPYLLTAAILPVILLAWFAATETGAVPRILLPSPIAVLESIPRVVGANGFGAQVARTLLEIVGGFTLGGAVGFLLGMLLSASSRLRAAYLPFLSALEAIPTVILAPIIIAALGFGIEGKVLQAAIACFYAVFITTLSGLGLAEPNAVNLMRSLGASKWQTMVKLRIPTALPVIFGGLQLGATTAIIGAIVSEFIGANGGLGYLMLRYRSGFDTPAYWVIIFLFLVIGLVAYLLIWFAERRIVFWRAAAITRPDLEKS